MLEIKENYIIPNNEISFQFARSSGPGGQNVNKVNSKAIMFWSVQDNTCLPHGVIQRVKAAFSNRINQDGFLIIHSEKYRDKPQNIRDCHKKLQAMILSVWTPPKQRKADKPSKGSIEKRIATKKGRSDLKKSRQKVSY